MTLIISQCSEHHKSFCLTSDTSFTCRIIIYNTIKVRAKENSKSFYNLNDKKLFVYFLVQLLNTVRIESDEVSETPRFENCNQRILQFADSLKSQNQALGHLPHQLSILTVYYFYNSVFDL